MELISMFDRNPPVVDLLVVDEAQHDAATSMANLHSQIRPRWTLGLSATPYRSDRIKLCFDQIIRDAGISQLIADGYLSAYRHFTIAEYTPQFVASMLIDEPEKWGQSLVFFHTRQQCLQCQALLRARNIPCDVVTATTNRAAQLEAFERGETRVLINMAILTEGFDCPALKTVFCRPSGKGCTIQMAGRVLRKCEGMPMKQVVQCRKTPHPMLKTAMAAEQYLWTSDGWRSIKANEKLDALTQAARQTVAQTTVELPKLVSMYRSRMPRWTRQGDDGI
jgi:superfamily II DNA or RNA helicase